MINVTTTDSAETRSLQISDIGGEFPSWSADGKTAYWAIGNAFVSYRPGPGPPGRRQPPGARGSTR